MTLVLFHSFPHDQTARRFLYAGYGNPKEYVALCMGA